jgi:hypothetical protein
MKTIAFAIVALLLLGCVSQQQALPRNNSGTNNSSYNAGGNITIVNQTGNVTLVTDMSSYRKGQYILIMLKPDGGNAYTLNSMLTNYMELYDAFEIYKLQGNEWVRLKLKTQCGDITLCDGSHIVYPPCAAPLPPKCDNQTIWGWNQTDEEAVTSMCLNASYTSGYTPRQVDAGTYKARVAYYADSTCNGTPKYVEAEFNIGPQEAQVGINQIYKYGLVHNFTYNLAYLLAKGTPNQTIATTVTPDVVNGTPAWLVEDSIQMKNYIQIEKIWIDKTTYKCLKDIAIDSYSGSGNETEESCAYNGIYSETAPKFEYTGNESVKMPAGTFQCDRYAHGLIYYWVSNDVPVPVKIGDATGGSIMELISYS